MLALILVGLIVLAFVVCLVYDQLQYNAATEKAHKAGLQAGEYYEAEYSKAYKAVMDDFRANYPVKF